VVDACFTYNTIWCADVVKEIEKQTEELEREQEEEDDEQEENNLLCEYFSKL